MPLGATYVICESGWLFLFVLAALGAAEKKLPIEQTSNDAIEITATPLIDKDEIQKDLGSDLGGDIVRSAGPGPPG